MAQKRLLTSEKSKLGNVDLTTMLRKPGVWDALPLEKRQELYSMLPEPAEGEKPHDPGVNPLKTEYRSHIEEALRKWQDDLQDGREEKKWRKEAMQAGVDRKDGKFDEWKAAERERYWGVQDGVKDENSGQAEADREKPADGGDDDGEDLEAKAEGNHEK